MDTYGQYARWRQSNPIGLRNRRLAAMLGDFLYETSSAEDESRRMLEMLHGTGERVLSGVELKWLNGFTSEHNRDQRLADGIEEKYTAWWRVDYLSKRIIHLCAETRGRTDIDFRDNLAALDRMFDTTAALREFRNLVDHRAPSDNNGRMQFYRDSGAAVSPRTIWGWTEVAASYWSNLAAIARAVAVATGIHTYELSTTVKTAPLHWPPSGLSVHALRLLDASGIAVPSATLTAARREWVTLVNCWKGD